jgi:hypothetical protein
LEFVVDVMNVVAETGGFLQQVRARDRIT